MDRTAVIAGVGPGLGESLARTFADRGCRVGLFARSGDYIDGLAEDIRETGGEAIAVPTDITDRGQVSAGFDAVRDRFGSVDVLVNHAESYVEGGLLDLSPADFEQAWRGTAYGPYLCSREAVPDMLDTGGGTILFTGASFSVDIGPEVHAPGSAKHATRALAEAMAREFGPEGVHVAHVVIDGPIDTPQRRENNPEANPDEWLDPDEIAETYWHLVEQDRSAWTLELDVKSESEFGRGAIF